MMSASVGVGLRKPWMPAETVARHRFAGRGDVGKATEDAAEVASHSRDDPKPVRQEGERFGPVGQQVGVDGDRQG